MCDKVEKVLQNGKLSSAKMTLHSDEDKELVDMMARYTSVYQLINHISIQFSLCNV